MGHCMNARRTNALLYMERDFYSMSAKKASKAKPSQKTKRSASRATTTKPAQAFSPKKKQSRAATIVIVCLAALMALSILLPSLSSIFAGKASSSEAEQAQSTTTSATEAASTSTASVASVDSEYEPLVAEQQKKLESDANNLVALLNLGNNYMSWAANASAYASTDEEKAHVSELYQKAIDSFNNYLAQNDSQDIHVRIALCTYYMGKSEEALNQLKDYTAGNGATYGPAWYYLGMMYQATGDSTNAKNAYIKATEVDSDDKYGSKTMATEALAQMQSSESAATTSSSSSLQSELENSANAN